MREFKNIEWLEEKLVSLLCDLIRIPSHSGSEQGTADRLIKFLENNEIESRRKHNNIYIKNRYFDSAKPTVLLNSHHDTIQPGNGWVTDPYDSVWKNGQIFGLGSNDAGASLISLLAAFLYYYNDEDLKYNFIYLASAEEENSGPNGIQAVLPDIRFVDFAIVGEPTGMQMAIAEKGLIVLECQSKGETGHAARDIGKNAIYASLKDIMWFENYQFPKISELLGPVKMTVTMINAGIQHNVIPDCCSFTIDIRSTDAYSHDEIIETIRDNIDAEISRCSLRLNPSSIDREHVIVKAGAKLQIPVFGSPTLSDQALFSMPSIKMGPGRSERSHTPNEYIYQEEIRQGIELYIRLLNEVLVSKL